MRFTPEASFPDGYLEFRREVENGTGVTLVEQAIPDFDFDAKAWDPPMLDQVGAKVAPGRGAIVKTRRELRSVIDRSTDDRRMLEPTAKFTSSKGYVPPSKDFLDRMDLTGTDFLKFSAKGEFGDLKMWEDGGRAYARFGAAIGVDELFDHVREVSSLGLSRSRWRSPLKGTVMAVGAVASVLASGLVSHSRRSGLDFLVGAEIMTPLGYVHREHYPARGGQTRGTTFGHLELAHSISRDFIGQGAPYGFGLNATIELERAPLSSHMALFQFNDLESLKRFAIELNQAHHRLGSGEVWKVENAELMDHNAMRLSRKLGLSAPAGLKADTRYAVFVEFSQFEVPGMPVEPENHSWDALIAMHSTYGLDEEIDVVPVKNIHEAELFREGGPDGIRQVKKQEYPGLSTLSTDFAVNGADEGLMSWYFDKIFVDLGGNSDEVVDEAVYGHLFGLVDIHRRRIFKTLFAKDAHQEVLVGMGLEIGKRERSGESVRTQAEKLEVPVGPVLHMVHKVRNGLPLAEGRRELWNMLDPHGLRMRVQSSRWQGNYDFAAK